MIQSEKNSGNDPAKAQSEILVSVWVITYNHEDYIGQCLDSILSQEVNFRFEICLGEDDSTDATRAICREYARKHPETIRLFERERTDPERADCKGQWQFNFIRTFRECRGKYIAACDGDDFWSDQSKLQTQVDFLEAHPALSGCFHKIGLVDAAGSVTNADTGYPPRQALTYSLDYLLRYGNFSPMFSVVFRNHANVAPDWICGAPFGDMIVHACNLRNGDYGFIDKVMGYYRIHSSGLASGTTRLKNVEATLVVYQLIASHLGLKENASFKQGIRVIKISRAIESVLGRILPPNLKSRLDHGPGRKLRAMARRLLTREPH